MRIRVSMAAWALWLMTVEGWVSAAGAVPREEAPAVRWERKLGDGALRTPAWRDGRLYVGGPIGSRDLFALNAQSGATLWYHSLSEDGPTSAIVTDDRVILGSESCHVHVIDAESGRLVWERRVGDYVTATPALGGGRVFAVHTDRGAWALSALALDDGRVLWKRPLPRNVLDAVVADDAAVLVATDDGRVWRIDARTGAVRWHRDVDALGAPVVHGGTVQVVTWPRDASGFVAVRLDLRFPHADLPRVTRLGGIEPWIGGIRDCTWQGLGAVALLPGGTIEVMEGDRGEVLACVEPTVGASLRSAPPAARPTAPWTLFVDRGTQHVTVLHRGTGSVLREISERPLGRLPRPAETLTIQQQWHYEGQRAAVAGGDAYEIVGAFLQRRVLDGDTIPWREPLADRATLPAVAGDAVVYGTEGGTVVARNAADGRLSWTVDVGHAIAAQPVVADGWVWATTTDGRVVGIETGDDATAAWPMWGGRPAH